MCNRKCIKYPKIYTAALAYMPCLIDVSDITMM